MPKKFYFWSSFLWTITIIVLSLVSFSKPPEVLSELGSYDKLAHFVFYFVFVFLWGNFIFYTKQVQGRTLFFIFWTALILGGAIEVAQELFTEKRTADLYDMLANFIGALVGIGVLYLYRKKQKTQKTL